MQVDSAVNKQEAQNNKETTERTLFSFVQRFFRLIGETFTHLFHSKPQPLNKKVVVQVEPEVRETVPVEKQGEIKTTIRERMKVINERFNTVTERFNKEDNKIVSKQLEKQQQILLEDQGDLWKMFGKVDQLGESELEGVLKQLNNGLQYGIYR